MVHDSLACYIQNAWLWKWLGLSVDLIQICNRHLGITRERLQSMKAIVWYRSDRSNCFLGGFDINWSHCSDRYRTLPSNSSAITRRLLTAVANRPAVSFYNVNLNGGWLTSYLKWAQECSMAGLKLESGPCSCIKICWHALNIKKSRIPWMDNAGSLKVREHIRTWRLIQINLHVEIIIANSQQQWLIKYANWQGRTHRMSFQVWSTYHAAINLQTHSEIEGEK